MAKVLVTGANGFLGSWLTQRLIDEGHETLCLVRKTSDLSELEGVPCKYVYGDITDINSLRENLNGFDTVFHVAGLIGYSPFERERMFKVNVDGTQNVIDVCIEKNVRKLVHISSVAAIGASFSKDTILNENSPYNIAHLRLGYFDSKHEGEMRVEKACREKKLDAVILNPSTIYGSGDARKGSRSTQVKVAQGKFKIYPPGGANVVAIEDVVQGILSAWTIGKTGERYILASENLLIKEVFDIIAEIAGTKPPSIGLPSWLIHSLAKPGDMLTKAGKKFPINSETAWTTTLYHWFDSAKAQRELNLKFKPAKFALENSVRWMIDNGIVNK